MKSAIEEIFTEDFAILQKIELSEKYWKLNDEVEKIVKAISQNLNEEEQRRLNELFEAMGAAEAEQNFTHFKEGFKLGMRLATEILT